MAFIHSETPMTFDYWLKLGIDYGFCGPAVCVTHDGIPMTEAEELEFEVGFDACVHMIRPYEDSEQKRLVEGNHAPSVWRQPT